MSPILEILLELQAIESGESDNEVWGLGLGVSPEARRWAAMGKFLDRPEVSGLLVAGILAVADHQEKDLLAKIKKRGRPKLSEWETIDTKRAFKLWELANSLKRRGCGEYSNRELINIYQEINALLPDSDWGTLFPQASNTLEQSVSRGKKSLEIEGYWSSVLCDKIVEN